MPHFPRMKPRKLDEDTWRPPAKVGGGVTVRLRRPKRSDGTLDGQTCPRCGTEEIALQNMDMADYRYVCTNRRCGYRWN